MPVRGGRKSRDCGELSLGDYLGRLSRSPAHPAAEPGPLRAGDRHSSRGIMSAILDASSLAGRADYLLPFAETRVVSETR